MLNLAIKWMLLGQSGGYGMTAAQRVVEGPGLGFVIARSTVLLPGLAALVNDMTWNCVM